MSKKLSIKNALSSFDLDIDSDTPAIAHLQNEILDKKSTSTINTKKKNRPSLENPNKDIEKDKSKQAITKDSKKTDNLITKQIRNNSVADKSSTTKSRSKKETTDITTDISADITTDRNNTKEAPIFLQSTCLTTDTTSANNEIHTVQSTTLTANSFDTPEQNIDYNQPDLHSEIIDKKNTPLSPTKKSTDTFILNEASPQVKGTDLTTDISADITTNKNSANNEIHPVQSTTLTGNSFDTPEQNTHYNQPDLHSEIIDKKNTPLLPTKKSTDTFILNEASPQVKCTDPTTDISADTTTDRSIANKATNQAHSTNLTTDITTDISADITTDRSFNNQVFYGQTKDIKNETTDKVETHPRTELGTYPRTRLDHNNIPERTYSELSKLQQSIIKVLYFSCVQNSGTISQKISINYLIDQTQTSGESIKRTIRRLIKENFLDKFEWKDGRGGWTKYELHPHVYQSLFGIANLETRDKTKDATTDKLGTYPRTNVPSSSIFFNNINKELTTNNESFNPGDVPGQQQLGPQFDNDWQNIDISPLQSIGFTNHHLSQLFTKNMLTPKQVQDSINAFAFDLVENKKGEKIKTSPLNLLMGILKGGNEYNPPKNFESEEDRTLREQVEAERDKLEKRQQMQSELKELKYKNWLLDLSVDKKLEILDVPLNFFEKMPIEAIESGLKKHFEMKVL